MRTFGIFSTSSSGHGCPPFDHQQIKRSLNARIESELERTIEVAHRIVFRNIRIAYPRCVRKNAHMMILSKRFSASSRVVILKNSCTLQRRPSPNFLACSPAEPSRIRPVIDKTPQFFHRRRIVLVDSQESSLNNLPLFSTGRVGLFRFGR